MAISNRDRHKLRHGQIVYLKDVVNSFGNDAAGGHYAVLLDTDEAIDEALLGDERLFMSMISTKEYEPRYLETVPARLITHDIRGNFICNWCEPVHVFQIDRIIDGARLFEPELMRIQQKYRQSLADKRAQKTKGRSTRS